jgi:hypothetical protein
MRASAERVRAAAEEAFSKCQWQVQRGLGTEARNLAATGAVLREQARHLEDDSRAEEEFRLHLSAVQAELIGGVVVAFSSALGLLSGVPDTASGSLWRELLGQAAQGVTEPRAPEAEAERVRDELRQRMRAEVRRELMIEELRQEAERAEPEPPQAEEEVEVGDPGITSEKAGNNRDSRAAPVEPEAENEPRQDPFTANVGGTPRPPRRPSLAERANRFRHPLLLEGP